MSKICTDLEQSRKLVELGLDPNTADMMYLYWINSRTKQEGIENIPTVREELPIQKGDVPAWSLTTLLNIAPKYFSKENHQFVQSYSYDHIDGCYHFIYRDYQHGGRSKYISKNKDLFDAAFEMVVWLLENKHIK